MHSNWLLTEVDTITSTMDWAHTKVQSNAPDFTAIVAAEQSGGRGRRGRVWTSPRGNLYFSFIVRPNNEMAPLLSLALGVALQRSLQSILPVDADIQLKWPNDVLINGKKISGILIERNDDALIVGIGVNVEHAPDGAAFVAQWRKDITVRGFLDLLMAEISAIYRRSEPDGIIALWNEHAAFVGQNITFLQGVNRVVGTFKGIDGQGRALLRCDGEQKAFASGEVMEVRACS